LKNSDDIKTDCAITCRRDLSYLHKTFIENAGGIVAEERNQNNAGTRNESAGNFENLCEISPLLSYYGEALEDRVKGKVFNYPVYLDK